MMHQTAFYNIAQIDSTHLQKLVAEIAAHPEPSCVGLSACHNGAGVTTITMNVAAYAAEHLSKRVLLVDANLQRPAIHDALRIGVRPGLSEIMARTTSLQEAIFRQNALGFDVITAGMATGEQAPSIDDDKMTDFIDYLGQRYDHLIFDLAPISGAADGVTIARSLDGIVIVLEAEVSRWEPVTEMVDNARAAGVNILGAVINKKPYYIPEVLYRII